MNLILLGVAIIFLLCSVIALSSYGNTVNRRNKIHLIGGIVFIALTLLCLILFIIGA